MAFAGRFLQYSGWHLANGGAIFQKEGRNAPARVDGAVGFGMLLALAQIDRDEGNRQVLLDEKNAHTPRIGRARGVVEGNGVPDTIPSFAICA